MSRWLATEGNVEAQINANKNKLEKCFDTVVLDNQDLTNPLTPNPRAHPSVNFQQNALPQPMDHAGERERVAY